MYREIIENIIKIDKIQVVNNKNCFFPQTEKLRVVWFERDHMIDNY